VTQPLSRPRALVEAWSVMLLAPVAWSVALGILFSLTNEVCERGDRTPMWAVALGCTALSLLPALVAWAWRRRTHEAGDAGERVRFMLDVALGTSALFTLVLLVTAVPVALLGSCRT
jgi:protein-S-isoprenylcysteine O-methyltransferase Ste14